MAILFSIFKWANCGLYLVNTNIQNFCLLYPINVIAFMPHSHPHNFFCYSTSSRIVSCVRTMDMVMWHSSLALPCYSLRGGRCSHLSLLPLFFQSSLSIMWTHFILNSFVSFLILYYYNFYKMQHCCISACCINGALVNGVIILN